MDEELAALRSSVQAGAAEPPAPSAGRPRRLVRRLLLRAMRPHTAHQEDVNRQVLAAIEALAEHVHVGAGSARGQLAAVRGLERAVEELRAAREWSPAELEAIRDVVAGSRGVPFMWELALEPFENEAAGRVYGFREGSKRLEPQEVYKRLEDLFRGPPAWVQDRQRPYVDVIGARSPVVDVGCGRGDFLDLLRERGVAYVGVEPDPGMLEACRARGHDGVIQSDANSYLEGVDDGSLGVVFAAQVLEHMPMDYLLRFLRLALAKLKPGGLLIAECPNPHSPHTMKTYWLDLTHENPVFPEVALSLCWLLGFDSAFVFHPAGSGDAEADRFKEPEYAVVATKSAQPG